MFAILFDQEEVEFNTADKLIAHINVNLWRHDKGLRQVYLKVDLSRPKRGIAPNRNGERRCERPGCSTMFVPARNVPWAKYCSAACKARVYRENRRIREQRERRYGTRYGECPKGHDRSPENTYVKENGRQACRVCRREAIREKHQTDEAYRIRVRDRERQRRAERRDEINARRRELHRQKKEQVAA